MFSLQSAVDLVKNKLRAADNVTAVDNSNVISRTRELIGDTVSPYRWSSEQITGYINDGLIEIKKLRRDAAEMANLSSDYEAALANYAAYRAFALDNDLQNNNGALSDKMFKIFAELVAAAPFYFTSEELQLMVANAVNTLTSLRPDLLINDSGDIITVYDTENSRYNLPERFLTPVAIFAASDGFARNGDLNNLESARGMAVDQFRTL